MFSSTSGVNYSILIFFTLISFYLFISFDEMYAAQVNMWLFNSVPVVKWASQYHTYFIIIFITYYVFRNLLKQFKIMWKRVISKHKHFKTFKQLIVATTWSTTIGNAYAIWISSINIINSIMGSVCVLYWSSHDFIWQSGLF